jgi:hypothetical protein
MALSDACYEFLGSVGTAARELAVAVEAYANPVFDYGEGEIPALRRACLAAADAPWNAEAGAELLRLAAAVLAYHDAMPGAPGEAERRAEMARLIAMLRAGLDAADAEGVEEVVHNIARETPFTEGAAVKLKGMLPKLGKATYDIAVKVITDIASETAKKILGI